MKEILAENKLSEIFVCSQQDRVCLPDAPENRFIVDAGGEFGNGRDLVTVAT